MRQEGQHAVARKTFSPKPNLTIEALLKLFAGSQIPKKVHLLSFFFLFWVFKHLLFLLIKKLEWDLYLNIYFILSSVSVEPNDFVDQTYITDSIYIWTYVESVMSFQPEDKTNLGFRAVGLSGQIFWSVFLCQRKEGDFSLSYSDAIPSSLQACSTFWWVPALWISVPSESETGMNAVCQSRRCCGAAWKWWSSPMKADVHQQRWFPGVVLVFDYSLFCSGCVFHSSPLVSVCSDNERRGHTCRQPTETATDRREDVGDRATVLSEQTPGVRRLPCARIPLPHPDCA